MYILEFLKKDEKKRYNTFDNFEFLLNRKKELEKKGNTCLVYKMSGKGDKTVAFKGDRNLYNVVTDFDKEVKKAWTQYVYIRTFLQDLGFKDFFVENNILYIKSGRNNFEIEKVRSTPRYEIRKNGIVLYDRENAQNEIVKKFFNNKGKLDLK